MAFFEINVRPPLETLLVGVIFKHKLFIFYLVTFSIENDHFETIFYRFCWVSFAVKYGALNKRLKRS